MNEGSRARRVLMVCMGNICRSPTAEGVLRHKLQLSGMGGQVEVDSAGTHATWHAGEPPDARAIRHAARRGYDIADLRARLVVAADFERFDLILAMDRDNLDRLEQMCPTPQRHKLGLLLKHARRIGTGEVPDPYQGAPADFEWVLDLVEDACEGLLQDLRSQIPAGGRGT
jgi:protein-tyrosine phosphatase